MDLEPNVEVTEKELAYRSKRYHDLRALRQRELCCTCCGNVLSQESEQIFSHPKFGIAQCRKCNDHVKDVLDTENTSKFCDICGISQKKLYKCARKNCPYKYCVACIKRNVPESLAEVESNEWKCLACNSKPLWKLRGVCAAVMSSIPKRTKTKKVSRNRSSDSEDAKSNLKTISFVRRRRLAEAKELQERLKTVCDEESPAEVPELLHYDTKRKIKGLEKDYVSEKTKFDEKNSRGDAASVHLTLDTSSNDSIVELNRFGNKKKSRTKSVREGSTEARIKRITDEKKSLRYDKSVVRKNSRDTKESRNNAMMNTRKAVTATSSESLSDDSDMEDLKRAMPSIFKKRKDRDNKSSGEKKKSSSNENSNDEKTRSDKKSSITGVKSDRGKTGKSTRDSWKSLKNLRANENDNSDSEDPVAKKNSTRNVSSNTQTKRASVTEKSTRDERLRKSKTDTSPENSEHSDRSIKIHTTQRLRNDKTRQTRKVSRDDSENEGTEGKLRKSWDHRRTKNQNVASDSSSGKEFCKSKLSRNSYLPLKRVSELEQDYTKSPDQSPEKPTDIISKDQTFALKNSVNNFFAELKRAAMKLTNDIEHAQNTYCMKDSMRPIDADCLIIETENVISNLKQCVDRGESKMHDYYNKWCKRTRVKNVLKKKTPSNDANKCSSSLWEKNSKKLSYKSEDSDNESTALTKLASPSRNIDEPLSAEESTIVNGTKHGVVSDYNSEEIFSDDETRDFARKSNRLTARKGDIDESAESEPTNEKTSRKKDISSDETEHMVEKDNDNDERRNEELEMSNGSSSPMEMSNSSTEKNRPVGGARKLKEKSILSNDLMTSRDSVDPSDVDIFEVSTVFHDDEPNHENLTFNKSDRENSRGEEKWSNEESPKQQSERRKTNDRDSLLLTNEPECSRKNLAGTHLRTIRETSDTKMSGNNENSKKIIEKRTTLSSDTETNGTINDNEQMEIPETDEISTEIEGSLKNCDLSSLTTERCSSISPNKDLQEMKDIPSSRSSLQIEKSSDEIELNEEDIPTECYVEATKDRSSDRNNEKNINDVAESILSLDTAVDEDNDNINKEGTKPAMINDSERRSSLDSVLTEDNNDNGVEISGSKSWEFDVSGKRSSLYGELVEENDHNVEETDSKTSKSNAMERRSSIETVFADDLDNTNTNSSSKSYSNNVSRASTSSNISESDNIRIRDMLLQSSNSDDSSDAENSMPLKNSSNLDNDDTPPTPPESDSNSRKMKNSRELDSVDKQQRTKRSKFRLEDNPLLMADKNLSRRCEVRVKRLEKTILELHSRALTKSRDYVDCKKLKRLVALDNLDKDKKVTKSSDNEDDDTASSKNLRNRKKRQATKEPEETLMDHLKRVRNGGNNELSDESDVENKEKERNSKPDEQLEESLFAEADRMAKKHLLESSDSAEEEPSVSEPQNKEDEEKEKEEKKKKAKKGADKVKSDKSSEDGEKKQEKADKGRWRRSKILTMRISDSDSEEEKKKFDRSQEKLSQKIENEGSQSDSEEEEKSPKKKRVRRRVLHSDSDVQISPLSDSESSDDSIKQKKKKKQDDSSGDDEKKQDGKKKTRKRIRRSERSSSSSDSLVEKRPKNRRKRIKMADSDSDSENDIDNSQGTPGKSGRKNIRKVIRDKQVADDTKQAAKDEEERLLRIAERQKLYNQMYETRLAGEKKVEKLVLDFDEKTKEPLVIVDEGLVNRLKPHQAQGIKFMWDACFESLERSKTTKGSGCILAHCMGLGKTFQIVSLAHTLLRHKETGINTIMVVCPLSTVLNWVNEFKIWLEDLGDCDEVEVYELTKMKKDFERKYQLQNWQKTGGVMIIGYEMFRNLSSTGKKVRKNLQDAFLKCLVDPGADLVVCDEGHLLKNEDTALSKAMRRVKTLRRIVLTGTPLQNNLIEYHCMVQFVKPNLLGTKKEFMNRFENPITNGQFDDSTEYDVKLMKKRAHVLHKMLEGSVQRLDYSVLTPFLPPKQEYVIFTKLTDIQIKMYQHYLDNYARRHRGVGGSLFADFQALQRIWTHPMVMQMNAEKVGLANEKKRLDATDSEGSLRDFIDDGSGSDSSNSSDVRSINDSDDDSSKKLKRGTRANPVADEPLPPVVEKIEDTNNDDVEWWTQFVKDEDYEDIRISSKLLLLFRIIKESELLGDKVLVFSQSLYSLTLIEKFLGMIDDETQRGNVHDHLDKHCGSWSLGLDYFRLDGQSSADNRRRWCDIFNRPSNTRARLFLISTRAGGLGINLTAANRVIIFDASWNPSHDVQSIFRVYRFGQKKPCYVYRLLAAGTMEEKIYNRQVTKLSLSCRVVDEQQIERHYSNNALAELYKLEISETETTLNLPKDRLLAEIFLLYKHCVQTYHEHDSLLENQAGEELDEEERQQAWLEYEEEKKGKRHIQPNLLMNYQNEMMMQQMNMMNMAQQNVALGNSAMIADYENLMQLMTKDYPGAPEAEQKLKASRAVFEMYNYVERQSRVNQNPMAMANIAAGLGLLGSFDNRLGQTPVMSHPTPDVMRMYQQSLPQQQSGQMNYPMNPINHGMISDPLAHMRNKPIPQMSQLPAQSSASSSIVDDDIVEIPSSPERNPVLLPPVPGGSRKSQEE